MPRARLTEKDCVAMGAQRGWTWLSVAEGEVWGARAAMMWECAKGCGVQVRVRYHNMKDKPPQHRCADGPSSGTPLDSTVPEAEMVIESPHQTKRGRPRTVTESMCESLAMRHDLHWLGLAPGEEMGSLATMRWSCIKCGEELPPSRYDHLGDGSIGEHVCGAARNSRSRAGAIGGRRASSAHKARAGAIGGTLASPVDKARAGAIG